MQTISVLSWNIQGDTNITGHTSLAKIKPHLLETTADILVLQEALHAQTMLSNIGLARAYYTFVPESNTKPKTGFNHSVVLSTYPIEEASEIMFPNWGQQRYLESVTKADIRIDTHILRIYNCHFPIFRAGIATRVKQLEYVLADSLTHTGPIIICGDLNTTTPKEGWRKKIIQTWHMQPSADRMVYGKEVTVDERELFNTILSTYGFTEVLNLTTSTWSPFKTKHWELFNLKLDWFMIKNLTPINYTLGRYVSDHRPIEVRLRVG